MWPKKYRDYGVDKSLINDPVESGRGIIGCEMHELNGWGNTLPTHKKAKNGFFRSLVLYFFRDRGKKR